MKQTKPFRLHLLAAALLGTAFLGACSTPYQRPDVQLPAQWAHAATSQRSDAQIVQQVAQDRWWQAFGDPQLNALVELALARNNDLRAAGWRLRNANLAAGNALGNRLPSLSGSGSAGASRKLDGNTGTGSNDWQRSYSASLGASWELDLWGKLASQQHAAQWEAAATEQDRQATAQALVANVLTNYWQLAVAEQKWLTQQETLKRAEKTLQLAQVQYQAGAISGLDLAQSRQSLANQQAAAEQIAQRRTELQNALAIVFDAPPGQLPEAVRNPRLPDLNKLPPVAAGVPAEVLGRRPDLLAAEMRLRGTLAQSDATRASYLPGFSLTSGLGSSSNVLKNVLSNPTLSLGIGLALPFLNIGQMQRNIATSENNYELAIVNFRQTLYKALVDVENALSNREHLLRQWQLQQQARDQAVRVEQLTEVRYRSGAVGLKAWLDAQEARRNAQMAVQDAALARLQNHVTLLHALGGSPVLPDVKQLPRAADTTRHQAAAGQTASASHAAQ